MKKCRRDQVVFHCTVSDGDAPVTWAKDGSQIEIDDEQYEIISQGKILSKKWKLTEISGQQRKLVIKNASFDSEGLYECRLPSCSTKSKLSISERQIEIVRKLSEQVIPLEGDAVFETVLNCLNAEPVWKKDGVLLKNGPQVRLEEEEHADGGLYRCSLMKQVLSDAGEVTFAAVGNQCNQSANLEVKDLPLGFSKQLNDQTTVAFTASITFECNTTRKGAATTWLVDGRPVEEGDKYSTQKKNFNRKLVIYNLTARDNYEVKCRVTDNGDSAETSCRLVTSKKRDVVVDHKTSGFMIQNRILSREMSSLRRNVIRQYFRVFCVQYSVLFNGKFLNT